MIRYTLSSFYMRLYFEVILCIALIGFLIYFWSDCQIAICITTVLAVAIGHFLNKMSIFLPIDYPSKKSILTILSSNAICFAMIWILIGILNLPYSLFYLVLGNIVSVMFCFYEYYFYVAKQLVLGYISLESAEQVNYLPNIKWIKLEEPKRLKQIQGYVINFNGKIATEWEKFLVEEAFQNIPIYHVSQIEELLTGRVKICSAYENNLEFFLPSQCYVRLKYVIDVVLVLLSLPIVIPIMLITAILIRLESPGTILFTQNRVGQGGKEFCIYKFRSMAHDSEKNGAKLASINDLRITRIGKFIRKTRIDELPQFFNVLKGDMSLIGPRPEQKVFVDQFSQSIPFYNYRHIVKPGLSGWAQVSHGYASDIEETKIKLEYDLYYIKHFSFSLDILIFFKTIKTMITGFGAR